MYLTLSKFWSENLNLIAHFLTQLKKSQRLDVTDCIKAKDEFQSLQDPLETCTFLLPSFTFSLSFFSRVGNVSIIDLGLSNQVRRRIIFSTPAYFFIAFS
eukprot:TRINITY_DN7896_c0_g1_i1.p1 TRINITY_DN7896_c0_g1~~TRINITY_DN7896_c0_g1_i1.p1  ORF type:complete len:100 (+),score=5.42 TRINITY_DN7896_c0_g1_i1:233-532(+)